MKIRTHARPLLILWSCAALLALQITTTAQTLTHRYTFWNDMGATNAPDVVGKADGIFLGDLAGGSQAANQLLLDGAGYVQLPPGIVTNDLAVTVEAWGDYPDSGQGTW